MIVVKRRQPKNWKEYYFNTQRGRWFLVFTITFENEIYKQWSCDVVFEKFENAKNYLIEQGFIERNRLFYRENHNWNGYTKAYISPMKIWGDNNG